VSRIATTFAALREAGRCGLIPYIAAGHPSLDATVPVMHALVAAGADIIELGMPFSDPMADGPVIQRATERAIGNGITISRIFEYVVEFRRLNRYTPVLLMGYLNSLEAVGAERFVSRAAAAGVDGLLLVDLPPEEAADYRACVAQAGLDLIMLVAPTTTRERLAAIAQCGTGFTYYVSFKGITGADSLNTGDVGQRLTELKSIFSTPVAVGFGIKDGIQAKRLAAFADAVVIGSALVQTLESAQGSEQAAQWAEGFLGAVRTAMDSD